jgi:hypothetical protein
MSKKFDAIIAKNEIARWLRDTKPEEVGHGDLHVLRYWLREIEIYIGEGNQPSISDIIESEVEL